MWKWRCCIKFLTLNVEVEKFPVMNFSVGVGVCALTNSDIEQRMCLKASRVLL